MSGGARLDLFEPLAGAGDFLEDGLDAGGRRACANWKIFGLRWPSPVFALADFQTSDFAYRLLRLTFPS